MANSVQETVELRLRTMWTLWFALFASVGLYYAFTFIAGRSEDREPNPTLSLILIVIGVSTTLISLVIKSKLINLAIKQQRVQLVQQAYITAWAITEVAALLGMLISLRLVIVTITSSSLSQRLECYFRLHDANMS